METSLQKVVARHKAGHPSVLVTRSSLLKDLFFSFFAFCYPFHTLQNVILCDKGVNEIDFAEQKRYVHRVCVCLQIFSYFWLFTILHLLAGCAYVVLSKATVSFDSMKTETAEVIFYTFGERTGGSCADLPLSIAQHAWRYREDTWSTWLSTECHGWPMGIRLHQVASNVSQLFSQNTCLYHSVLEPMFLEMVGDVPITVHSNPVVAKEEQLVFGAFNKSWNEGINRINAEVLNKQLPDATCFSGFIEAMSELAGGSGSMLGFGQRWRMSPFMQGVNRLRGMDRSKKRRFT